MTFPDLHKDIPHLQRLLAQRLSRAQDPVQPQSYALSIQGQPCGHVFTPALQTLRTLQDIQIDDGQRRVDLNPSTRTVTEVLADVAVALRADGRVPFWRDEQLDVWSKAGQSLGTIERGVTRPLGLLTVAVHLNAWSAQGQLWVARRSLSKPTDPGRWDNLVGGLVAAGEEGLLALSRETQEEAGLKPAHLAQTSALRNIVLMRRQLPEGYQREMVQSVSATLSADARPVNLDGESMTIECLPISTIIEMLEEDVFTLASSLIILDDLLYRALGKAPELPLG